LNASTQQNVVTYQVVANVANQDLKLRPSMTANLNIVIETSDDVVRVPNQALRFKPTSDMYAALGLQAPTPGGGPGGQGGPGGRNGQNANANGANSAAGNAPSVTGTPAPGGDAAAPTQTADASQNAGGRGGNGQGGNNNRRAGGGRGGNNGFGQGGGASSMTPEQRQALMNQFGGGRNGRGGRGNRPAANDTTTPNIPLADRKTANGEDTDGMDDLFAPLVRTTAPGTVYVWDEAGKQLKRVGITVGITDGQLSEVIRGDLQPGQQVVTSIILPVSLRPSTAGNPLMGNQPRGGGPGGMTPGGGGGGGAPGGGGGGRGGKQGLRRWGPGAW